MLASLFACAGLSSTDSTETYRPIDLALSEPVEQLHFDAGFGQANAQYALSIIARYGLRGTAPDQKAADTWLARAWKARRLAVVTTMEPSKSAIYVGGVEGAKPEVVEQYDLSPSDDRLMRECLGLLTSTASIARLAKAFDDGACGGAANYQRLKTAWLRASTQRQP